MIDNNIVNQILNFDSIAVESIKGYKKHRYLFDSITKDYGRVFIGIAGLRGSGKSIILKQARAIKEEGLYISLDVVKIYDLYEYINYFRNVHKIKYFYIDEITYLKDWAKEIKKIYDFSDVQIYFTSSVAIDIIKVKWDLTRRVKIFDLPLFSLSEYIYFTQNDRINLSIKNIENNDKLKDIVKYDYLFDTYTTLGIIPVSMENKILDMKAYVDKIILTDIRISFNLTESDINDIYKILEFIANSNIDDVSYSSISKNIGINKYGVKKLTNILEMSYILNIVKPQGSNVNKEPKILFSLPFRSIFSKNATNQLVGGIREDFFVYFIKKMGLRINYIKGKRGEKTADYNVQVKDRNYVFEIGGRSKKFSQIKDGGYILTFPSRIDNKFKPLTSIGFLL